jgi:hypothetical protein
MLIPVSMNRLFQFLEYGIRFGIFELKIAEFRNGILAHPWT